MRRFPVPPIRYVLASALALVLADCLEELYIRGKYDDGGNGHLDSVTFGR